MFILNQDIVNERKARDLLGNGLADPAAASGNEQRSSIQVRHSTSLQQVAVYGSGKPLVVPESNPLRAGMDFCNLH